MLGPLGAKTSGGLVAGRAGSTLRAMDGADDDYAWSGLDLTDPEVVVDLLERAGSRQHETPGRRGSVVELPREGRIVLTGDLHDHGGHLLKILRLAGLAESPANHVLFHEVIHGEQLVNGRDLSVRTLARLAALKLAFPDQVHLMLGNHEAAQVTGRRIMKGSTEALEAFDEGIAYLFGDHAERVDRAVRAFLESFLLAVRTESGLLASHSLPSASALAAFDPSVLERPVSAQSLDRGGSAYDLLWGRNPDGEVCERLGEAWGVSLFVTGHQPTPFGYDVYGDRLLVLGSDHEAGVALPVDLAREPLLDELIENLVPLHTVSL